MVAGRNYASTRDDTGSACDHNNSVNGRDDFCRDDFGARVEHRCPHKATSLVSLYADSKIDRNIVAFYGGGDSRLQVYRFVLCCIYHIS